MGRELQRQIIHGEFDPQMLRERIASGWRVAAIEWIRDTAGDAAADTAIQPPFGLRIAADCQRLEEHPDEAEVLRTVMRMIVRDEPISRITAALNASGHRTRAGRSWTEPDVFALMPVLVDQGPRIFGDARWAAARQA